ncbi:MAG TPA: phosphatase PAP2 family protein [Bacteroidia bacterium]|nr:phosphatase PAP2 family protein [Bacteroidia bacterium]
MSSFINKNRLLFLLILVFAAVFAVELAINPKGALVVYFNGMYSPAANTFFSLFTHVGSGGMFIAVALLLIIFIKIRWGIIGLIGFAASGLITQFLKQVVFGPSPRPHKYFEGQNLLDTFDGQTMAYIYSFPSGHSTSAFALFALLSFIAWKKPAAVVLFFCAGVLTGLSRIYLAQHFTEDVLAGGLIGFTSMSILYYLLEERRPAWLFKPSLDKPLVKIWTRR